MNKTVRNTFFTVTILVLTSIALKWHKAAEKANALPDLPPSLVAGAQTGVVPAFNLTATYLRASAELGQTQLLTIETVPGSVVEITTRTSDGQIVPGLTRRFNSPSGRVELRTRLTNFDQLGQLTTIIRATSGTQIVVKTARFTAIAATKADHHRYPLLP